MSKEAFSERHPTVICPKCKTQVRTDQVEFLNIEEDERGHDLLTFGCPQCKEEVQAYVRAG